MNKVEELIQQLCPAGVVFKELGELGYLYGGLTGKSKIDFQGGNAKFVTYMNIFSNISVKTDIDIFVNIGENENQNKVEYGDVLFTGSSETPNECGMSSVLTEKITEPLYLNSFSFGFRLHDKELFLPDFLKYLFRDDSLRKQIGLTASGVTRFNISKKRFAKVTIPIPPIPIQHKIAFILDSFTQLEAELEAELEARRAQYEYYKNELLNFEGKEVEWKTLGEVGQFVRGNGMPKSDFTESGVGCIHYGQIYTFYGTYTDKTKSFVSHETAKKLQKVQKNDLIITNTSENIEDVCKTVVWLGNDEIVTGGHASIFKHNENPKYLAYYTQTQFFFDEKKKHAKGTKVIDVSAKDLAKIRVPIPPLAAQEHIVGILDKFNTLVNDISVGLPAEIQARRKQYEYYRGKLLDFKSISNG
jgi:type I restriction enzyme S subunit